MIRIRSMTILTAFCCAVLLTTCPVHADSAVSISAPHELQVCQRNDKDQAGVVIAGVLKKGADVIEAKADLASGVENGEAVGWTKLAKGKDIVDGKFTGRVTLKTIIESLNRDAGYDVPWFVAQASFHPGSKEPEEEEVAKGQKLLWEKGVAKRGPNTDELGQEYRSDRVHFNQKGLSAHAERWWKALAAGYKWKLESSQ